jgi:NADPH-dependent FMN reductase
VLVVRDWPLPMFADTSARSATSMTPPTRTRSCGGGTARSKEPNAYLVITPEYKRSVPGVLKNACDSVWVSFAFGNKPVVAVGYSGGIAGGVWAIEHVAQIGIEAELVPLRAAVVISQVSIAFDDDGRPVNPVTDISLRIALDDLAWLSRPSSRRGPAASSPAVFRIQAAAAAANEIEEEAV